MTAHDLEVPIVDLNDIHADDPARKKAAAAAIRKGLGEFGLIYVRNHGVDIENLERFYDAFVEVTQRPAAEKKTLAGTDVWYQRGWTPPNTEQAVVAGGQPDFKECFFVAPLPLDEACKAQYPTLYCDNIWPKNADAFERGYMTLGAQVHAAGASLLRAAAISLDLEEDTFTQMIEGGPHVSRALRYLPLNEQQVNTGIVWGEEHTDFNLLTLLPGGRFFDPQAQRSERPDNASGLYLRTRSTEAHPQGQLVRGTPPEGCIVAQVGQQLEILTGGTFLATPHVITAPTTPGYSRTSFAHFVHVHSHTKLFPLAPFQTAEAVQSYSPPVLAGTYAIKTLVDIGLAPKDALDQLGYRHYGRLASIRSQLEQQ